MPPHCDTLDGPVVKAAAAALQAGDVDLILPYAPETAEEEIKSAFAKSLEARRMGGVAADVADRLFYETVVRLHRAGEGAAFTGLKPAGLDVGPVIPLAEDAIHSGHDDKLIDALCDKVRLEVHKRFQTMKELEARKDDSVADARRYVSAMLGLQVYCHKLFKFAEIGPSHQSK